MRTKVLGLPVDILTKEETFEVIEGWLEKGVRKPKIIVTAYSEFFVNGQRDKDFSRIIQNADLVTPDGKSVLAAVKYQKASKGKNLFQKLLCGLSVGGEILSGAVGESVTGVWLFDKITSEAERRNWRIFLLGGMNNVGRDASEILLKRFPKIKVAFDAGEDRVGTDAAADKRAVDKINRFNPDFLFVQYNPVVQEKWIDTHKDVLKVGVAMGYGGTLDEYVGRLKPSPSWFDRHGLKWLWRLIIQPRRWRRMIDAVIVFPWFVFRGSLRS